MIDGIIALVICYFTKAWYQPYFDRYTQIQLAKGYPLESIKGPLDLFELVILISAFLVVYGTIKLIKYFLKKF